MVETGEGEAESIVEEGLLYGRGGGVERAGPAYSALDAAASSKGNMQSATYIICTRSFMRYNKPVVPTRIDARHRTERQDRHYSRLMY